MEPHTVVILALAAALVIALVGAVRPGLVLREAAEHQLLLARLITLLVACVCVVFLLIEAL